MAIQQPFGNKGLRRVHQKSQKKYKKRKPKQVSCTRALTVSSSESNNGSDGCELSTLWDDWFDFHSDDEIVSASSTDSISEQEQRLELQNIVRFLATVTVIFYHPNVLRLNILS